MQSISKKSEEDFHKKYGIHPSVDKVDVATICGLFIVVAMATLAYAIYVIFF